MNRYNLIWLKQKSMAPDWHEQRAAELELKIDECTNKYIKLIIPNEDYFIAYLPVLNKYMWSRDIEGVVIIFVK